MAILFPSWFGQNYSQANWSLADDNARNHAKPGAGDSAVQTVNSGPMDIDEDTAALAGWDATGYVETLGSTGAWTVDIDGDLKLSGNVDAAAHSLLFEVSGNFEAFTGLSVTGDVSLKHNDVAANARTVKTRGLCGSIKFEINNPGITSLTVSELGGTIIKWKKFVLAANAKYAGGAFAHEIDGDLLIDSGVSVYTTTGEWEQTASGDIKNNKTTWAKLLLAMEAGTTSQLIDTTKIKAFEHGSGTVTESGARTLYLYNPADNFWTAGAGPITASILQIYSATSRVVDAIHLSNVSEFKIRFTAGNSLTMNGDLNAPNTTVIPRSEAAGIVTLDMNGHSLTCDVVSLGGTAADRLGAVLLRNGVHNIGSIQASLATQVGCEVDLGSSYISLSGTMLGIQGANKITFTNVACRFQGGTITGCDLSGTAELTAFGSTNGTGNTNVTFNEHAHPMGLALLGAGI